MALIAKKQDDNEKNLLKGKKWSKNCQKTKSLGEYLIM